jgi:hypothetical protein
MICTVFCKNISIFPLSSNTYFHLFCDLRVLHRIHKSPLLISCQIKLTAILIFNCWRLKCDPSNSSGHYMYHQFNTQQLYALPTQCI